MKVHVEPQLLHWAVERAGIDDESLHARFPRLGDWGRDIDPTLKQLEDFAKAVHVPIGYLFLTEPPHEEVPIPDLRTIGGQGVRRPSPDLLDTIYSCQQRQAWYRDHALSVGESPLSFVGSADVTDSPEAVAEGMRSLLKFSVVDRRSYNTSEESLRRFIERSEELGILVMVNGVVGSNTHRTLDPEEFRGFAFADDVALLVFVNGADSKSAQMFTLAHELAHIWLGQSALSNVGAGSTTSHNTEVWCNRVAAELLVPMTELRQAIGGDDAINVVSDLARFFKVSTLVILRRLYDAGDISKPSFESLYASEIAAFELRRGSSGGNYYKTQPYRLGRRFASAFITSAIGGQTLFRDAYRMLGVSNEETFRKLGKELGVMP